MAPQRTDEHKVLIAQYVDSLRRLEHGQYDVSFPRSAGDIDFNQLAAALDSLSTSLRRHQQEIQAFQHVATRVREDAQLEDILETIYTDFQGVIPFNRIGFALLDADDMVRSHWVRSDPPAAQIGAGYAAPLAGSSLEQVVATGTPRIINDLQAYYAAKPGSDSSRRMLEEGIRSSLTCPLFVSGVPVGFLFFSSIEPGAYQAAHVHRFEKIASEVSLALERSRLIAELVARRRSMEHQNAELRRLNDELLHGNEMKNEFMGMVVHDLRNPIGNIRLAAELLTDVVPAQLDERYTRFVFEIINQSDYMLELIGDLLDVSEIESGHLSLSPETIDVAGLVADSVDRYAQLARYKQVDVTLVHSDPGTATADRLRVRQALDNLLSNAVKFSPPGTAVTVRADCLGAEWRVAVRDQGPGIPEGERKRLFHYFERLSTLPTGNERGNGLGLAITRMVVEAQGGRVGVESHGDGGSVFWFTLAADVAC